MLRLVVIACALAAVSCQEKPCCPPDKWEGLQAGQGGLVTEGKAEILTIVSFVAFDRTTKRLFSFTNTTAGTQKFSNKIYQAYAKGALTQYVYDVTKGTCTKSQMSGPYNDGCIPKDAKFNGKFTLGAGKETLRSKSYSVHVDQTGAIMDASITVTEEQCIPIGENVVGSQNKVPLAITYGFVNITPGIRNPAIFTPPDACLKNATETDFLPEVHQHRHVLF